MKAFLVPAFAAFAALMFVVGCTSEDGAGEAHAAGSVVFNVDGMA
ncbi:MAG: hypothetical protein AAF581_07665 [Planctomycetota bacterium]